MDDSLRSRKLQEAHNQGQMDESHHAGPLAATTFKIGRCQEERDAYDHGVINAFMQHRDQYGFRPIFGPIGCPKTTSPSRSDRNDDHKQSPPDDPPPEQEEADEDSGWCSYDPSPSLTTPQPAPPAPKTSGSDLLIVGFAILAFFAWNSSSQTASYTGRQRGLVSNGKKIGRKIKSPTDNSWDKASRDGNRFLWYCVVVLYFVAIITFAPFTVVLLTSPVLRKHSIRRALFVGRAPSTQHEIMSNNERVRCNEEVAFLEKRSRETLGEALWTQIHLQVKRLCYKNSVPGKYLYTTGWEDYLLAVCVSSISTALVFAFFPM